MTLKAMFESQDERERRERAELDAANKARAEALVPEVIAEQPARFTKFEAAHAADVAGYSFRCERYGDFLAVFMQRGPEPEWSYGRRRTNKQVSVINLMGASIITLNPGRPADLRGDAYFSWHYDYDSQTGKTLGIKVGAQQPHYDYPRYQIVTAPVAAQTNGNGYAQDIWNGYDGRIFGVNVESIARPAEDDRISFQAAGVTLHMPFGCGEAVYASILKALAPTP